ncbi:MAG: O-methyltransferase [Mycoplasmoidaceae bacterium]
MDLKKIKSISIENNIPILRDESAEYISKILIDKKVKLILEIGSGMGYSSMFFLSKKPDIKIVSIEKNIDRYNFCLNNIKNENLVFLNECAFSYSPNKKYDCIFLDGPKSKQKDLFEKYLKFLNEDGIIIIDNIFLKFINKTKNNDSLLKKAENFRLYLNGLNDWEISIIDIDDGIAICKRKKNYENSY